MTHTLRFFALVAVFALTACSSLLSNFGIRVDGDHITYDGHINFESGSDVILEDSHDLLNALIATLNEHEEIHTVQLVGHTDSTGPEGANQTLSARRAAAVATYLREGGVTQTIRSEGRGESDLLCEEDTDECHARNRRVEFVIVD